MCAISNDESDFKLFNRHEHAFQMPSEKWKKKKTFRDTWRCEKCSSKVKWHNEIWLQMDKKVQFGKLYTSHLLHQTVTIQLFALRQIEIGYVNRTRTISHIPSFIILHFYHIWDSFVACHFATSAKAAQFDGISISRCRITWYLMISPSLVPFSSDWARMGERGLNFYQKKVSYFNALGICF